MKNVLKEIRHNPLLWCCGGCGFDSDRCTDADYAFADVILVWPPGILATCYRM
jgi:hypothetical protein